MKKFLFLIFFICGLSLSGQTVSGYVDAGVVSSKEVHLSQVSLNAEFENEQEKRITTSIDENGFFKFKTNKISNKDAMYRIYVTHFENALKDTLQVDQLFLFSKNDSIHFKKSKIPFNNYLNSNVADKEWQKLRRFENELRRNIIFK